MAAYGPGVLVGNWNEAAFLEEDRMRDFIRKRDRGELLMQKIGRLEENLLKKIKLSVSKDGFICFGDTVMLLSPDSESSVDNYTAACGNLTLAINLEEISIYSAVSLQAPCGVSAVKTIDPLYLASDHKSFIRFAKKSHLQQVFLTDELSYLTCWQAAFLDPQLRLEYEGSPVPANSKVIITHCHTNRSLAVPRNFWTRSYFGREYEVICHTYLDSHRVEEDKNYWVIVTANPGDDGTMIDRPDPQPGAIGKKEFCQETENIKIPDYK